MSMVIRPCSEFPNANTDLHAGAIFGCSELRGPCHVTDPAPPPIEVIAERSAPRESGFFTSTFEPASRGALEPHGELELEEVELPDVAEIEPFLVEGATPELEADADEPGFARVVAVLTRIGRELGGDDGPVRVHSALSGQTPLPPPIAFALLHWRALLEGEDSTALPELTLDEWSAGFLAALFGADARDLRNRVRSEGIAAFGVLSAA